MSSNGNGAIAVTPFEPSRYLTKIGSADYLEVRWRLVWLRHDHPDADIDTELVSITDQAALFKARISIPGGGAASGFGSETPKDFRDYIEKAETKAIGRALAALGYGTQFCPDFDFGANADRVVDSPVTRGGDQRQAGSGDVATERQIAFLRATAEMIGLDAAALDREVRAAKQGEERPLTRREASALIDRLKTLSGSNDAPAEQTAVRPDPVPPPQGRVTGLGPGITEAQNKYLHKLATDLFGDEGHHIVHVLATTDHAVESVADLSKADASKLIEQFKNNPDVDGIREYVSKLSPRSVAPF